MYLQTHVQYDGFMYQHPLQALTKILWNISYYHLTYKLIFNQIIDEEKNQTFNDICIDYTHIIVNALTLT